jgi:hypothetical protein
MYHVDDDQRKWDPYRVNLSLNGEDVSMEVDTGASKTIISEITYKTLRERDSSVNIKHSNSQLRTYTGKIIPMLGTVAMTVKNKKQKYDLTAEVVQRNNPYLLGRD